MFYYLYLQLEANYTILLYCHFYTKLSFICNARPWWLKETGKNAGMPEWNKQGHLKDKQAKNMERLRLFIKIITVNTAKLRRTKPWISETPHKKEQKARQKAAKRKASRIVRKSPCPPSQRIQTVPQPVLAPTSQHGHPQHNKSTLFLIRRLLSRPSTMIGRYP